MGVGHSFCICAGKQFIDREERNCLVCERDFCISVLSGYEWLNSRHQNKTAGITEI